MSVSSSHHIQDCSGVPHDGGVIELISEECILLIRLFCLKIWVVTCWALLFLLPPITVPWWSRRVFFFLPLGYDQRVFWGGGVGCWLAVEGICLYVHHICAYMSIIWCHQHLSSPESLGPHPRGCVAGLPTGLVLSVVLSSLRPSSLLDLSKNGLL